MSFIILLRTRIPFFLLCGSFSSVEIHQNPISHKMCMTNILISRKLTVYILGQNFTHVQFSAFVSCLYNQNSSKGSGNHINPRNPKGCPPIVFGNYSYDILLNIIRCCCIVRVLNFLKLNMKIIKIAKSFFQHLQLLSHNKHIERSKKLFLLSDKKGKNYFLFDLKKSISLN